MSLHRVEQEGLAVSILARAGFPRVSNVLGGLGAWQAAGYPVERAGAG